MLPEQQYLDIIRDIRDFGKSKPTRQIDKVTGAPLRTRGIAGATQTYYPEDGFPLLSVRPFTSALYAFIGEMLWIISGSNLSDDLHKYGVLYWDDWIDPEWLTPALRRKMRIPKGSFGETYGPMWRNFRGPNGKVCDQMKRLFHLLRTNPADKRMKITPWNPTLSDNLVVRPCHGDVHFLWEEEGNTLSLIVNQMSADVPIGIPSNLAMYAFLLRAMCMIFGFELGEYTHKTVDTHYYSNQKEGVEVLCAREARPFPTFTMDPILPELIRVMVDDDLRDPLATKEFNPDSLPYKEWVRRQVTLVGYTPQAVISKDILPVAI
jgi:thymidylate synthase